MKELFLYNEKGAEHLNRGTESIIYICLTEVVPTGF